MDKQQLETYKNNLEVALWCEIDEQSKVCIEKQLEEVKDKLNNITKE
jgi:hypothetical protein